MTRRKVGENIPVGTVAVDPATGIHLLEILIKKAQTLLESNQLNDDDYSQWELITRGYLEKAFGHDSPNVNSVLDVGKYGAFPMDANERFWELHNRKSLVTQVTLLNGLVELLGTELQLRATNEISPISSAASGHRIFVVHGHDEASLAQVAQFLEKLDQESVVLREQPNEGRTIIEKFEDYSDVGFAVVILTPDDRGGSVTVPWEEQNLRARQNVILELGYFIGRLGRNRVCALFSEGIEIPSDYSGVLYVPLHPKGNWRLELAKELRAAGLQVDMNKAL